jgi:hypothetical protein
VKKNEVLIQNIEQTGVTFFQDFTNFKGDQADGLTVDHTGNLDLSSIASSGYFLSSLVIGVNRGYLDRTTALSQARATLNTLLNHVPHYHGFFAHFIHIKTGERHKKSEYSTIDSALVFNGILTVDQYFKDPEISRLAKLILDRVNWDMLIHQRDGKSYFYMAYNPDADGDYVNGKPGFIHHWSMHAEQVMMYVMYAAVAKDASLAIRLYEDFERKLVSYKDASYYYTPGNTLFVYQYPQCWLDLKSMVDHQGINWFENTRQAIYGHYYLSRDKVNEFPTFGKNYFGFTASYGRHGYQVSNALPNSMNRLEHDGSVATNAMIGSLYHAPELAIPAIETMKQDPRLWDDRYGFINAFNDQPPVWLSSRWLGIDKGLELLMANAYLHHDVMDAYMAHPLIQKGMQVLKWKKIK